MNFTAYQESLNLLAAAYRHAANSLNPQSPAAMRQVYGAMKYLQSNFETGR